MGGGGGSTLSTNFKSGSGQILAKLDFLNFKTIYSWPSISSSIQFPTAPEHKHRKSYQTREIWNSKSNFNCMTTSLQLIITIVQRVAPTSGASL